MAVAVFPPQLYPSCHLLRYLPGKRRCGCRSGCWGSRRGNQRRRLPRGRLGKVSQPAATGGSPWSPLKLLHLVRTTKFSLELGFEPKYNPELGSFSSPLFFLIRVVYVSLCLPQESLRQGGTSRARQPSFFLCCTTSLEKPLLLNALSAQPFREGPAQAEGGQSHFTLSFCLVSD